MLFATITIVKEKNFFELNNNLLGKCGSARIFVSNAFTNGDGTNDVFIPKFGVFAPVE